jgi:hypothetical protein
MTVLNPEATQTETIDKVPAAASVSNPTIEANNQQVKTAESGTEASEDPNWRAFREARKKDRADKEAAERRAAEKEAEATALKAAMEAAFSKSAPTPQAYQQYYGMNEQTEESEEQRIEKKVEAILAQREKKFAQEQAEREIREYPNRIQKEFPDFRQVCSQENLDYLDYHYPEVSRPLQRLGDGFEKWHDIYHAVKKFIPNQANAKKDMARADLNSNKPRSISSSAPSPTGEKGRETLQDIEQRRAENWSRMQRLRKGVE